MNNKMTKAVIYARYSSHNQREESIEGQLRECHEFADKNDMIVINEYCDRALSGKTDNRPMFQKLIKDSERGEFDVVIMYTLDRFARNRYDSAIYKAKLKRNGVKVLYAKQSISEEPEGIILESVLEGMAEYYSENLARGVRRGMRENAMKGIYMGKAPYGYVLGEDKHLEINPLTSKGVHEIFQKYSEGMSMAQIVEWLNDSGYKTASGHKFVPNSLQKILRNEKYIGVYRFGDLVVENAIPPIIDNDLFEKVQNRLKRNSTSKARNKAKVEYLLSGKLFCGHCGKLMVGESGVSHTGQTYHYYKCQGRKRHHTCDKAVEKKDLIERTIVGYLVNTMLTDENIEEIATRAIKFLEKESQDTSFLVNLKEQLKDTNKRLKNMIAAIENGVLTSSTKHRLEELEELKAELEAQIAKEEIQKPLITKDQIKYWMYFVKNGNMDEVECQHRVIDILVNSIFAYDEPNYRKYVILCNISGNNVITIKGSDIDSLVYLNKQYPNQLFFIKHCFGFAVRQRK